MSNFKNYYLLREQLINDLNNLLLETTILLEEIDHPEPIHNPNYKDQYQMIEKSISIIDEHRRNIISTIKNYETHILALRGETSDQAMNILNNVKNKIYLSVEKLKQLDQVIKEKCLRLLNTETDENKITTIKNRIKYIDDYDYDLPSLHL